MSENETYAENRSKDERCVHRDDLLKKQYIHLKDEQSGRRVDHDGQTHTARKRKAARKGRKQYSSESNVTQYNLQEVYLPHVFAYYLPKPSAIEFLVPTEY